MDSYDSDAHFLLVGAIVLILISFLVGAFCGARL